MDSVADELARCFENYEPDPNDEIDVEAVKLARTKGVSWASIGTFVGTTREAVRQKYTDLVA